MTAIDRKHYGLRIAATLAGLFAVTVLAGCAAASSPAATTASVGNSVFGHIHGLGVDSQTGNIYVATHEGLYGLTATTKFPVRSSALGGPIAGLRQDTMGFAMVQRQMFGSGHPDPARGMSEPSLGLISSADQGASWQSLSLKNSADFHDLELNVSAAGLTIYGFDQGMVRVSRDGGRSWTDGATIALRDLASDPEVVGTVYAATIDGVLVSRDFGATFAPLPDSPPLYLIASMGQSSQGSIIGVDVSGAVWVKSAAQPWRKTGAVTGQADTLTFSNSPTPVLVAADERGVVSSDDLGATWRILVTDR